MATSYAARLPICSGTASTNCSSFQGVHYRILYFFAGRNVVVVSHGIVKESEVPDTEVNRAVHRKKCFEADPGAHSYRRSQ